MNLFTPMLACIGSGLLAGPLLATAAAHPASYLVQPDSATKRTSAPTVPLVIGHAGSGFVHLFNWLPPSSLHSIRRALDQGAEGVEVDVRLSQDSIPVLYHDPSLETMTNGHGCVSQTPAAVLTRVRYQVGWPADWLQHEQPVTFETLLARLHQRPAFPYLHLDLHEEDACSVNEVARSQALARRLVALLAQYHVPSNRLVIISNQSATLRYLGNLLPDVPLGFEMTEGVEEGFAALQHLPLVQAAVLRKDAVTTERVAQLHALGFEVIVFGGRSARAVRRVVAAAPDAYEVDNVRRLQAMLRRREP